MAKILANINYIGSIGPISQYSVAVTSGALPTWITSQNPVYTNLPSRDLITSWYEDTTQGQCFISDYTNSTNFQITHSGSPQANVSGTLITVSQYWDAGQANSICKIAPNSPPISGMVSNAAGNFGADGGFSVDLSNAGLNKSVWLFADTFWVSSNSGRTNFINVRNTIAVQSGSGRNLSNDSFAFYQRGTNPNNPTDFLTPSLVTNYEDWTDHYWPLAGGYCGNSYSTYLFSVARTTMNTYTIGRHTSTPASASSEHGVKDTIIWINNITNADPRQWNMQEIQWPFGERFINPTGQVIDLSDGFLYIMASYVDPTGTEPTYGLCLCRVPKNDVVITSGTPTFMRTELYMGSTIGWVKANWLQNTTDLGKIPSVLTASGGFFGNTFLGTGGGLGSVAKNSDGTFVEFEMSTLNNVIKFRRSNKLTGTWSNFYNLYYLPLNTQGGNPAWYYMPWCHPEQNWTGKATDDLVLTVSNNLLSGSLRNDTSAYWLQVLRVTGL